ncbi:MAG: helix-turn-helix transcriptional regulator [Taibaiella sp.]|jgi:DNA-binding CsgD family transcriptional regulator
MNNVSKELRKKIDGKLHELNRTANEIPGVIIVHHIPAFSVEYISERGLNYFGVTLEEIRALDAQYHAQYFNEDDATDYFPKVVAIIEKNDLNEMTSYFQQVRKSENDPWTWHFSTTKIFMQDDDGKPLLSITIALPVDAKQHISTKLERLLEEHIFFRKNQGLFMSLTSREKEILRLLALSLSAAEIAEMLVISTHTVETHRKNLRKKLSITSTYELSKFASAFDLI